MSRLPTFLLPLMLSTAGCVDKSDDTAADTGSGPGATWGDGGSGGDGGADGGAYLTGAGPESLYIEEVEHLWDFVAYKDEWGPLHEKVERIRAMGRAMGRGLGAVAPPPSAGISP